MTTSSSVAELDARVGTPEFDVDPLDTLRGLREEDPVHWSESIGAWLVTRYDDVVTTFKRTDQFSNEGRQAAATRYLPPQKKAHFKPLEDHYHTKGVLNSDPPDHTRLRALVLTGFNPRAVEAMRPRIQAIVDNIFDKAASAGGMEVIGDLAWALPSTVLAELMGAPPDARPLFKRWADDLLGFQGVNKPGEEDLQAAQRSLIEARAYLLDMIQQRRRQPTDDLWSHLSTAEVDGSRLSDAELLSTGITLLGAGQETTTALVGNGILLMMLHQESWAGLKADPALIPSAVEEFIRYETPIPRQARLMKADAELGGKHLRRGDVVMQMLNAANRDPEHFTEPDVFDIRRRPNRHLGFGLGAHFCVGAPLSRLEGQIVFTTMVKRFPEMRLVDDVPHWNPRKRNSRVLEKLDVQF